MRMITDKIMTEFKLHLCEEEKSDNTIEKYMRDISAFRQWIKSHMLDKASVIKYKQYLVKQYAPSSVNSMLSSINGFFDYNEWHDLKVKSLKVQKQLFVPDDKELSKDEYQKLLVAACRNGNERIYYVMQTIASTGIRVSELKFITVEAVQMKQATISCKGKMRVILLSTDLCTTLEKYIKKQNIKSGSVFITKTGKPLNRSNIWSDMKKLCKTAGVSEKKVFPHNLRHLFARTYYSLQKDIVRLADILGHSSINTTRIYTMESGVIHRRQIQRIGQIFIRT